LVAFHSQRISFEETQMTNNPVGSRIFTKTITGHQGDIISYACTYLCWWFIENKYIKYKGVLRWYCTQNSQLLQPTPTAALQT
jgi:hypothetical protein